MRYDNPIERSPDVPTQTLGNAGNAEPLIDNMIAELAIIQAVREEDVYAHERRRIIGYVATSIDDGSLFVRGGRMKESFEEAAAVYVDEGVGQFDPNERRRAYLEMTRHEDDHPTHIRAVELIEINTPTTPFPVQDRIITEAAPVSETETNERFLDIVKRLSGRALSYVGIRYYSGEIKLPQTASLEEQNTRS